MITILNMTKIQIEMSLEERHSMSGDASLLLEEELLLESLLKNGLCLAQSLDLISACLLASLIVRRILFAFLSCAACWDQIFKVLLHSLQLCTDMLKLSCPSVDFADELLFLTILVFDQLLFLCLADRFSCDHLVVLLLVVLLLSHGFCFCLGKVSADCLHHVQDTIWLLKGAVALPGVWGRLNLHWLIGSNLHERTLALVEFVEHSDGV